MWKKIAKGVFASLSRHAALLSFFLFFVFFYNQRHYIYDFGNVPNAYNSCKIKVINANKMLAP
jgi:hypothetical protein